jgi:hypothetical protein
VSVALGVGHEGLRLVKRFLDSSLHIQAPTCLHDRPSTAQTGTTILDITGRAAASAFCRPDDSFLTSSDAVACPNLKRAARRSRSP